MAERKLMKIVTREVFMRREKSDFKTLCVFEYKEGLLGVKTNIVLSNKEDFQSPFYSHLITKSLLC